MNLNPTVRKLTTALAALALATAILALLAPSEPATALTLDDPCPGPGVTDGNLSCQEREGVGGLTTRYIEAAGKCPEDTYLAGTEVGTPLGRAPSPFTAGWDWWGETGFLMWNADNARFTFGSQQDGPRSLVYARSIEPQIFNWWLGPLDVRVFFRCESLFDRVGRLAPAGEIPAGDYIEGGPGRDTERGGRGVDLMFLDGNRDLLRGGRGGDQLLGGRGDDVARGGSGSDSLFDDQGIDRLDGGPGNDRFSAKDDDADTIVCGGGEDVAVADTIDLVRGCEHVFTSAAEAPAEPPRN